MDYIVEYLKNPISTGVYNCQITFKLNRIVDLYTYLVQNLKRGPEKTKIKATLKEIQREDFYTYKYALDKLSEAINIVLEMEECPKPMRKLYDYQIELLPVESFFGEEARLELLNPVILRDKSDVICCELLNPREDEVEENYFEELKDLEPIALDITSVKEKTTKFFLTVLRSIPAVGKSLRILKDIRRTFSSRFAFRPYPSAVRLWLRKEPSKTVPKDLRDFVEEASKYHSSEEWRTSIVLSAIAVESLLADLYEEQYHQPTPSKATLGELFELVKKKVDFPANIREAVEMANNARISAVHRSRFPVSDREATNALYGATNFAMWYFSQF